MDRLYYLLHSVAHPSPNQTHRLTRTFLTFVWDSCSAIVRALYLDVILQLFMICLMHLLMIFLLGHVSNCFSSYLPRFWICNARGGLCSKIDEIFEIIIVENLIPIKKHYSVITLNILIGDFCFVFLAVLQWLTTFTLQSCQLLTIICLLFGSLSVPLINHG